jgi:hypothetical protein
MEQRHQDRERRHDAAKRAAQSMGRALFLLDELRRRPGGVRRRFFLFQDAPLVASPLWTAVSCPRARRGAYSTFTPCSR